MTLSFLAAKKIDLVRALVYVAAQCLGAFLATGALYLALPHKSTAEVFVNRVSLTVDSVLFTHLSHAFIQIRCMSPEHKKQP